VWRKTLRVGPWRLLGLGACALLAIASAGVRASGEASPEALPQASAAARLAKGDHASEYWDLAATFDSGHRIVARFQVTNEGPGKRTAYALGHVLFPDGRAVRFQNGRLEDAWQISDDRLRLTIGSSVLDLHAPSAHLEVDKNSKGIKIFLDYAAGGPIRSWSTAPDGYHVDLLTLGGAVSGTLWVRDVVAEPIAVSGTVSVTHTWMDASELDLTRRRVSVYGSAAGSGESHLYLLAVEPRQGPARSWVLVRTGEDWLEAQEVAVLDVGEDDSSRKGYPVPRSLSLDGTRVQGRVELGRTLLRHDPLALVPRLFRWFLAFRSEPSEVWIESRYAIEWQGQGRKISLDGTGAASFYYLNPSK
jgi:hypothetical protein